MYTSLMKAQDRCGKWSRLEIPPVAKNIMPTDSFWERESQFTLKLWTLLVYHASDEGHIFKRMCSTQVELDGLKNVGRKVGWVENELGMWGEYDQNAFNEVIKELIKIKKESNLFKKALSRSPEQRMALWTPQIFPICLLGLFSSMALHIKPCSLVFLYKIITIWYISWLSYQLCCVFLFINIWFKVVFIYDICPIPIIVSTM